MLLQTREEEAGKLNIRRLVLTGDDPTFSGFPGKTGRQFVFQPWAPCHTTLDRFLAHACLEVNTFLRPFLLLRLRTEPSQAKPNPTQPNSADPSCC